MKDTSPKNSSSIPLRHFLSCSARSWPVSYVAVPGKIVLSNVFSLASSPLSTERRVEEADGSGQMFGTSGRTEQSQNSESECSPSPPVDTKGVNASGWSKEEVVNWPNAISISRLLSGPLLAWMITQGLAKSALICLVIAGGSDWLDGYMARRQGINSVLGSYLDPLADKVLVGCVAVSMAYSGLLHPALVALIVARDGALLVGSFVYRAYSLRWQWSGLGEFFKIGKGGVEKVEPLYISKVNMVLQLALVGTALMLPALEMQDTYSLVPILSWSVVATTTLSWAGYGWIYFRRPVPTLLGGVTHLPQRANTRVAGPSSRKMETFNRS